MTPEVTVTEEDIRNNGFSESKLQHAANIYNENGCLIINNIFSKEFIDSLRDSYIKQYKKYFIEREHSNALRVGDKRYMITVKLATPFNTPKLYANPFFYELIKGLLGDGCILQALGSVTSLPGSEEQHWHRDHPPLFYDTNIDPYLPSYAITVIIPLIDLNELSGTTAMMLKSHRFPRGRIPNSGVEIIHPEVPVGSCLLFDYNIRHAGQANNSSELRPVLYNSYSRPWFRDHSNFKRQYSLVVGEKEIKKVPEEYMHLFKFAHID